MRRRAQQRGNAKLTHDAIKRLNDPAIVDTARQSKDLSITTPLKHWFDFEDIYTSPISLIDSVRDYITLEIVENNDAETNVENDKKVTLTGAAANSIKCSFTATGPAFTQAAIPDVNKSRLYFLVAKARFPTPFNAGGGVIGWAGYSGGLRVRSNRITYIGAEDETKRQFWTNQFCRGSQRVPDVDYVYGAAYRAPTRMEHYSYHDQEGVTRLVGQCDVSDARAQTRIQEEVDAVSGGGQAFWTSHGVARNDPSAPDVGPYPEDHTDACGGLYVDAQGNQFDNPSDMYTLMLYYFDELPPQHVIESALEWCRIQHPLGNKVVPPHFIPYL